MEEWQREYIRENGSQLINDIDCNVQLLTHLRQCNVLAAIDVEKLNVEGNIKGQKSMANLLLQLLTTRINGYKVLAQALYHCKQSGPFITLLYGVQINVLNCKPLKYCNIVLNPEGVLSKNVLFQGVLLPLKEICSTINSVAFYGMISDSMDASTYQQFMNNNAVVLAKDTIPDKKPYYIPRTLCLSTQLDPQIFQVETNGIFLIEGIRPSQLFLLTKTLNLPKGSRQITVESSRTQTYGVTSRFIVLEHHKDYDVIVQKSTELNERARRQIGLRGDPPTVYWVHYIAEKYHYVKSSGGAATVQTYINPTNQVFITQDQFIQKLLESSTPIVLYDSPGMGKTILLAELARCVKSIEPSSLVVFLRLPEIINKTLFNQVAIRNNLSPGFLKPFLINLLVSSQFDESILTKLMDNRNYKIYLFFDGFDEIEERYISLAKSFLKCASQVENFKVVLSTRSHYSTEIENLFGVVGYKILAFQEDDQVSFFLSFWKSEYKIETTDRIRCYAKECLKSFHDNISNEEKHIAGIPLQCKMLADIYAAEAERDGNDVQFQYKLGSIYDMYDNYIISKISQFCADNEKARFYEFFVKAAFQNIFPEVISQSKQSASADTLNKIYQIGIMEPNNSDITIPVFVHRTFAEFLCGKFTGRKLCEKASNSISGIMEPETVDVAVSVYTTFINRLYGKFFGSADMESLFTVPFANVLMENIFKTSNSKFQNVVVIYFLNQFLEQSLSGINTGKLFDLVTDLDSSFSSMNAMYSLLCASLDCSVINIFILVLGMYTCSQHANLDSLKNDAELKEMLGCKPHNKNLRFLAQRSTEMVDIAIQQSSVCLFKLVCHLVEVVSNKNLSTIRDLRSLLQHVTRKGNYQIFEYIFNTRGTAEISYFELLHNCVVDSYRDIPEVIDNKCKIFRLILSEYPELLTEYSRHSSQYPLLVSNVHLELVKFLIDNGVPTNEVTPNQDNVAHLAARIYSGQEFKEFVKIIISHGSTDIFGHYNRSKQTPVDIFIRHGIGTSETWKLLVKNCKLNPCSALTYAVEGRSIKVINNCIESAKDNDVSIPYDHFVYLSVKRYNTEAMKYFVRAGGNVNKRHKFGSSTVLGRAIAFGPGSDEMVRFLVEHDVNVNAPFLTSCYCCVKECCCCFCITNPLELSQTKFGSDHNLLINNGAKEHLIRNCILALCLNLLVFPCNFMRMCCVCQCLCVKCASDVSMHMCGCNPCINGLKACCNVFEKPFEFCMSPCNGHIEHFCGCYDTRK